MSRRPDRAPRDSSRYAGAVSPTRIPVDSEILKRAIEQTERLRKLREEIEEQQERLDSATGRGVGPDLIAEVSREAAKLLAKTTALLTESMSEAAGLVSAALDRSTDAADQSSRDARRWQKFCGRPDRSDHRHDGLHEPLVRASLDHRRRESARLTAGHTAPCDSAGEQRPAQPEPLDEREEVLWDRHVIPVSAFSGIVEVTQLAQPIPCPYQKPHPHGSGRGRPRAAAR